MKVIIDTNSIIGKKLNIEDIENFEKRFNIKLPQSYKDFLLEYNGGQVDLSTNGSDIFYRIFDQNTNELIVDCYVGYFRDLGEIEESLIHLKKSPEDCYYLDECIKRGALVIAFGDPMEISIGINEDNFGKIYRSSFSFGGEELELIADSFEKFINSFEEEEDY